MKLSTTVGRIQFIPNSRNIEIVNEFLTYMRNNSSSKHHQNNNLKVVIAFGSFLEKDNSCVLLLSSMPLLKFSITQTS